MENITRIIGIQPGQTPVWKHRSMLKLICKDDRNKNNSKTKQNRKVLKQILYRYHRSYDLYELNTGYQ